MEQVLKLVHVEQRVSPTPNKVHHLPARHDILRSQ
jgi:hypothetical protein